MTETRASSPAPEPLSAAEAVAAGTDFAELAAGPAGLVWNQYDPQDGSCRLWHWSNRTPRCLTAEGFSVRSRVYEYGGGAFCLTENAVIFVNESDQQLYYQPLDSTTPRPLTHGNRRHGGLYYAGPQVLAVEEQGTVHRLVAISLATGSREVLAEGADFYASPIISDDRQQLAWIEWQRPDQPWTRTRLMSARRLADGGWSTARCVAGDQSPESLQQPRFNASGRLYCLSDRNGFWQPWCESPQGFIALPAAAADHASAPWQLGGCSWLPTDEGYLAAWQENGYGVLGLRQSDHSLVTLAGDYSRFRSLAMDDEFIYFIAASPSRPSAVVAVARDNQQVDVLAGGIAPLPEAAISQPQPLSYPSGDGQAHGYFYPPNNGAGRSPVLVFIHGGPTSACYPVFDPRIQFWTQRGFAVVDLNYRGSTGYGRAYRQSLHLNWGVLDVEDACAAVAWLAKQGLIDAEQAFIRGGSAGGYTALCALAFTDVFRGGASLYGVSDPLALGKATHKFEGDYLDWLIGDPEQDADRYRSRTPLEHAGAIRVPVIFFQGELDAVVVPDQTRHMLKALQDQGIAAEAHFYADERHGFRKAINQADALAKEWQFYTRILAQPT